MFAQTFRHEYFMIFYSYLLSCDVTFADADILMLIYLWLCLFFIIEKLPFILEFFLNAWTRDQSQSMSQMIFWTFCLPQNFLAKQKCCKKYHTALYPLTRVIKLHRHQKSTQKTEDFSNHLTPNLIKNGRHLWTTPKKLLTIFHFLRNLFFEKI